MQASERHDHSRPRVPNAAAIGAHPLWLTAILAAAHFALFQLAFPPWNIWPATLVAIVPLVFLATGSASAKRASLVILGVGALAWLIPNHWIFDVTALGYPLLGLYLSTYPAVFVLIIRAWSRSAATWPMTVVVPVTWVGLEFLRGAVLFDGYPWFLSGHPLINVLPVAQVADLFGTYAVSLIAAMGNGLCVDAIRAWRRPDHGPAARRGSIAFGSVIAFAVAYGSWRIWQADGATVAGPGVLAVQTNLPQSNKIGWSPDQQAQDIPQFIAMTEAGVEAAKSRGQRVDLVAWPETMLPGFGLEPADIDAQLEMGQTDYLELASQVLEMNQRLGVPVLIGSPVYVGLSTEEFEDDDGRPLRRWIWREHYNSAYLIDGSPPYPRYDKVFLTPFGETMPYISAWPWLERRLLSLGAAGMSFDLDRGRELRRLQLAWTGGELMLATPICFEDTVAPLCRRMIYSSGDKIGHILLNLSNDGWFGSYDGGRAQHLQIARFRCIENRVPMVRAVNTGLSVAIDSTGRVVAAVRATVDDDNGHEPEARVPGTAASTVMLDQRRSLYGTFLGDTVGWMCLGATLVMLVAALRRRRMLKGTTT